MLDKHPLPARRTVPDRIEVLHMLVVKRKYFAALALSAALWALGAANIVGMYGGSTAACAPIHKGNTQSPCASLMFNVDWGEEYIPQLLDILKEKNAKATFFPTGTWVERNAELAKKIVQEGHEVGNHGASHLHVETMPKDKLQSLILKGEERIQLATGVKPSPLFAPPYGEWNDKTVLYALEIGYQTVLWTVDTVDWRHPPPETIWKRALAGAGPGCLILLHPTENTVAALPTLIDGLREKGLMLVTVSENIARKPAQ